MTKPLKEKLVSKKDKNGMYSFWLNNKNVTVLWMDFFSSLPMEKEKRCVELFLKKYGTNEN